MFLGENLVIEPIRVRRWRIRDLVGTVGVPGCVGYHLCNADLRNECRKRVLRDAAETPDTEVVAAITAANVDGARWMRAVAGT